MSSSIKFHEWLEFLKSETGLAHYCQLVDGIADLHDRKQQDYGTDGDPFANLVASEEFNIPAWVGAIIRLNDKISRIKSFLTKGRLENESLEDSMLDIAVYALIAKVLYDRTKTEELT